MRKISTLLVVMMLISMFSMISVSADTISIFGSNAGLKKGTAHLLVQKDDVAKQLIVAGYNGNALTVASAVAIEAGDGIQEVKVPALSSNATSAKFFLWDNLNNMTPLEAPMTSDLTQQEYYTIKLTIDDIKNGGWGYSTPNSSSDRIGTNRAIPVLKGSILTYKLNGMKLCIDNIAHLSAGKDETIRKVWITQDGSYTVPNDSYLALTLATPNDDNITKDAFNTYKPEITIQIPYASAENITSEDIAQGGYAYGAATEVSNKIRVNQLIPITPGSTVNYDVNDLQIHIAVLANGEESNSYAENTGWVTGSGTFNVTKTGWLAIIMMINDDTPITVADYDKHNASISINHVSDITVITPDDIEHGAYGHGCELNDSANLVERLRVNRLIPVNNGGVLSYHLPAGIQMYVRQVKVPTTSNDASNTVNNTSSWVSGSGTFTATTQDGYFAIAFKKASSSGEVPISLSDYNAQIAVKHMPVVPVVSVDTKSTYPADRRIIQKVNNEWTFVYLPENYDPNRAEKYPLVIGNHGNGWKMDGTEQMANWTDITSYRHPTHVKADRNHVANENSDVWYSNEIIETLLDRGYIVAGAENGQGALYGNDECREACANFYEYMVANYNIDTDNCFMLGASNGCMTSLNAATYLYTKKGVKIKGLILQYPLCSLKTHYLGYSNHQAGIKSAYGVSATLNDSNFYDYIDEEYDPVRMAETLDYFPATLFCYSTSDTTTPASINTTPLLTALQANGFETAEIAASGNHGHPSHFKAKEFADWLDTQVAK